MVTLQENAGRKPQEMRGRETATPLFHSRRQSCVRKRDHCEQEEKRNETRRGGEGQREGIINSGWEEEAARAAAAAAGSAAPAPAREPGPGPSDDPGKRKRASAMHEHLTTLQGRGRGWYSNVREPACLRSTDGR